MSNELKVLDLFSGIGGFSLGLELASPEFETIAFCEFDEKCREVLQLRWPGVPIYNDVRTLLNDEETLSNTKSDGDSKFQESYSGKNSSTQVRAGRTDKLCRMGSETTEHQSPILSADVIVGGYPCQPFSQAGKRMGETDDRHLWPEMYRIIKTVRPRWVIAENVAGHITMGLDSVLSDLENEDYTCWTFIIPACAKNALHRRDRVWILATHTGHDRRRTEQRGEHQGTEVDTGGGTRRLEPGATVADTHQQGSQGRHSEVLRERGEQCIAGQGSPQPHGNGGQSTPGLGGELDGLPTWLDERGHPKVGKSIPRRVARLKQLGNAVVPQVVEEIGKAILEVEDEW